MLCSCSSASNLASYSLQNGFLLFSDLVLKLVLQGDHVAKRQMYLSELCPKSGAIKVDR